MYYDPRLLLKKGSWWERCRGAGLGRTVLVQLITGWEACHRRAGPDQKLLGPNAALCSLFCVFCSFALSVLFVCCLSAPAYELQGISAKGVSWELNLEEAGTEDKRERFAEQGTLVTAIFLASVGCSFWTLVYGSQHPQSQQIYFSLPDAEKKEILGPLWDQTACRSLDPSRGPQFLFSSHFDLLLFSFVTVHLSQPGQESGLLISVLQDSPFSFFLGLPNLSHLNQGPLKSSLPFSFLFEIHSYFTELCPPWPSTFRHHLSHLLGGLRFLCFPAFGLPSQSQTQTQAQFLRVPLIPSYRCFVMDLQPLETWTGVKFLF